ncbi:hypothetical protein AAFX91_11170 [Bradyrhizobium sp. 31Argb]|uniref:hypothetical protein n=1 Tax=unclassified Bradyrhizobium TaxID=2631580 RepID=UPI00102E30E3|nr:MULTISPECIES: hypothetical protein [unclassified Bradyrhizobium]MDI4238328.1 hypothetical protein [Bradyrhizobium sp. Arg237L]
MAIIRKVKTARGTEDRDITQPTLSYPDTDLPRVIVEVWNNRGHILDRDPPDSNIPTKQAVAEATELINRETGMALRRAVIITEEEHDNHYAMQDDDEIVFVLPNLSRIIKGSSQHQLLESAKLLMACTPNGI